MDVSYVEKAKAFIDSHLKTEFSLNELAEYIGYSAFHLAREFKSLEGLSIMEYARNQRILAAAEELKNGRIISEVAAEYGFETHAGFTKAFAAVMGCTPSEYQAYVKKMGNKKGVSIMEDSKIVVRHICKDDVQDLWENVYSAMTPRQIAEDKIQKHTEAYQKREGLELVAEVDGTVVMSLPLTKPMWIPLGFVWDNNFTLTGGDNDVIMAKLLDEMKRQARMLDITTLVSPQGKDSPSSKAMQSLGFVKAYESGGWEYLMMAI